MSIVSPTIRSNSNGLMRTNAMVKGVSSVSAPAKMRTWPRSSFGFGEKKMLPSPSRTRAVTPSAVSETKTWPEGSRTSKSTERSTRFCAVNCLSGCRTRRWSPSTVDSKSAAAIRQGCRSPVPPRGLRMSRLQVAMRPRGPVSTKTSTVIRKPSPGSVPASGTRSRSFTTARVTPTGTADSKNVSDSSRSAVAESRSVHRWRSMANTEASTAWRNA